MTKQIHILVVPIQEDCLPKIFNSQLAIIFVIPISVHPTIGF